jgi:hypothetical protein
MTDASHPTTRAWIRATWAGWLFGIPCIIALALVGEMIGIGGVQSLVGAGIGTGVGLLQARALRGTLPAVAPWFWSSAIGLAIPFLPTDIAKAMGREIPYSLQWCVAAGGLVAGFWQSRILRARFDRTYWWIVASSIGWSLAGATSWLADRFFQTKAVTGLIGGLGFLGIIASGGVILGAVTSIALTRMARRT